MIGYLCTRIVPVTSNEIARTFDNIGMLWIKLGDSVHSRIRNDAYANSVTILRILSDCKTNELPWWQWAVRYQWGLRNEKWLRIRMKELRFTANFATGTRCGQCSQPRVDWLETRTWYEWNLWSMKWCLKPEGKLTRRILKAVTDLPPAFYLKLSYVLYITPALSTDLDSLLEYRFDKLNFFFHDYLLFYLVPSQKSFPEMSFLIPRRYNLLCFRW